MKDRLNLKTYIQEKINSAISESNIPRVPKIKSKIELNTPRYIDMPSHLTSCIISRSINARDLKFSQEMVLIKMKICKTPGWSLSGLYFARCCVNYTIFTYLKICPALKFPPEIHLNKIKRFLSSSMTSS